MSPIKIYIGGPYSKGDTVLNVRNAVMAAEQVLRRGHIPYIPHLTMLWHFISPHEYQFWLDYDIEWLRLCDALLRLPGESSGADKEVALSEGLGKPVYYSVHEIPIGEK